MTDETQEPRYGQYLSSKKAMVAYGLSEDFNDESNVATSANNSASWAPSGTIGRSAEIHPQAGSLECPRFFRVTAGTGKTYILLRSAIDSVKLFGKLPVTLVTSGVGATPIALGHGGSMATQQPATAEDESVEEIIWRAVTTLSPSYRVKLAARLGELQKAVREESDGLGINTKSLDNFIKLLKEYPALRRPAISVTPELNIYATWKSGSDQVFSINFFPDGGVRFVIFCPNDKHPGEIIRLSGAATMDMVMSVVEPHGVLKWAIE